MRRKDIDLIKLIGCFFIVILHTINPGTGVKQCIYLLGSYGIPLFFLVNGYLMIDKSFSFKYLLKKAISYVRFILIWGLLIGTFMAIKNKDIVILLKTILGAFIGKGKLFHLWFLAGLLVLYFVCFLLDCLKVDRSKILTKKYAIIWILLVQLVLFIASSIIKRLFEIEIRDIIFPSLRVITNINFFFIGGWVKGNEDIVIKYRKYYFASFWLSYILLCITSYKLDILWASSLYNLPLITLGSISIVGLLIKKEIKNKLIISQLNKSIGIWILHPFVLNLSVRYLNFLSTNSILSYLLLIIICILISEIVVTIAINNKMLKKLFEF